MEFNFDQFETLDNTRERKGGYTMIKEQAFDNLKYRKAVKKIKDKKTGVETSIEEGRFYISKKRWKQHGLATNGLRPFNAPDGSVYLAVVAIADAVFCKTPKAKVDKVTGVSTPGKKSESFTSPKLEAALTAKGVIDSSLMGVSQFIDLTTIGTSKVIKGVTCAEVFAFSKGVEKVVEPKEAPAAKIAPAVDTVADATGPGNAESAPKAAGDSNWD